MFPSIDGHPLSGKSLLGHPLPIKHCAGHDLHNLTTIIFKAWDKGLPAFTEVTKDTTSMLLRYGKHAPLKYGEHTP